MFQTGKESPTLECGPKMIDNGIVANSRIFIRGKGHIDCREICPHEFICGFQNKTSRLIAEWESVFLELEFMRFQQRFVGLLVGVVAFSQWNLLPDLIAQERQIQQEKQQQTDELFSGPQIDEAMPELAVLQLYGDSGKPIAVVPGASDQLQLIVFVHERTRPAFGLVRGFAAYSKHLGEQIDSSVVFLTDDVGETKQWSINARQSIPEGARMFVSADGIEGPGSWGLNRNVMITVVLGRDGKVLDNFAIVQPSASEDLKKVSGSIAKSLGIDSPTEKQLTEWLGQRQMDARGAPIVDIRSLLSPVIQKTATPEKVEAAAKKVEQRAAKDSAFKIAVGNACRRIVEGGVLENYGTEPAQVYLKSWAETFKDDDAAEMKDKDEGSKTEKGNSDRDGGGGSGQ